jgi:hypothetical protein
MGCRNAIGQNELIHQMALLHGYTEAEAILLCSLQEPRYVCCSQQLQTAVHNDDHALAYTAAAKRGAVNRLRQAHPAGTPAPQNLADALQEGKAQ